MKFYAIGQKFGPSGYGLYRPISFTSQTVERGTYFLILTGPVVSGLDPTIIGTLSNDYLMDWNRGNAGGNEYPEISATFKKAKSSEFTSFSLYIGTTNNRALGNTFTRGILMAENLTLDNIAELETAYNSGIEEYKWYLPGYVDIISTEGFEGDYKLRFNFTGDTAKIRIKTDQRLSITGPDTSTAGWSVSPSTCGPGETDLVITKLLPAVTGKWNLTISSGSINQFAFGTIGNSNVGDIWIPSNNPLTIGGLYLNKNAQNNNEIISDYFGLTPTYYTSTGVVSVDSSPESGGNLTFSISENTQSGNRTDRITMRGGTGVAARAAVDIVQRPNEVLNLTPNSAEVSSKETTSIQMASELYGESTSSTGAYVFRVYSDRDWIHPVITYRNVSRTSYIESAGTVTISVDVNATKDTRTGNVYIVAYYSSIDKPFIKSIIPISQESEYSLVIDPETLSVGDQESSQEISVEYSGEGTLSSASNVDWIKNLVISDNKLTFDIEENPGDVRTGIITVTDGEETATCTVEQSYTEVIASNITVNKPTDLNIPKTNQILDLDWTATGTSNKKNTYTEVESNVDWITVSCPSLSTSDLIYTLNPTGSITVTANTGEERTGILTLKVFTDGNLVASEEIVITQEGNIQLTMSGNKIWRSPEAYVFQPFNVTYNGSKKLSYKVDQDWITIDNINEKPDLDYYAQVTCSVIENPNPTTRSGVLTVSEIDGNLTVSAKITQFANIVVNPSELDIPQTGSTGSISMQTDQLKYVILSVDQDWITASLDGNVLSYSVTENTTEETRTGNIILKYFIQGINYYTKTIPVTQSGIIPELTIDPVSKTVINDSGSFDVVINYTGSKNLSRFTDSDWLSFEGNTISYTENTGIDTRTSKATITDGTLSAICTVVQTGVEVTLILEPDSLEVDKNQHTGSLDIVYNGRDNLVVTSSSWITSVLVNGKINYTITSNPGTSRTGFIQVTDGNLTAKCTVVQTDQDTILRLDPNSIAVTYAEYTGSLNVIYTGKNNLTVSSQQDWINPSIQNNAVNFTISANELESDRTGTIQVTDGNLSAIASIRQYAKTDHPTIAVLELEQSVDSKGGELSNTVISVGDVGEITVKSQDSWVLVDIDDHTIKAIVSQNDSQARQAVITVSTEKANSVSYVINQKGVARDYIYFESGTKQIDYQGGTITNKLITNGTDPNVICDASWVVVNPDFTVTVATNSDKSDRQAVVTGTSSVGTAMYTIYQAGNTTDIPIWRITEYSEETEDNFIEYHIDSEDKVLYAGKVYVYPDSDTARFCINDIVSNYLTVMPFPEDIGNTYFGDWKKTFKIVTSSGESEEYTFYNDWSYNEDSHLNNKIVDYRQPFIISGTNMYFSIGSLRFDVYGTYRIDLNGLYPCGTPIEVYQNDNLIKTYEIDSTKKNYVIYWANKFGGWDFLPIMGNDMRTDQVESNKYSLLDRYIYYDTKYQNTIKPSWKLYTGWMKGNISDLVESVDVRLYDLNKQVFYKVLITDSQAEYRTYRNNGNRLVSYEINCEMSNQYIRK